MKSQDLRMLSAQELSVRIHEMEQEYYGVLAAVQEGKEKNSARLKGLRRTIARAKTVLQQQKASA